jgi:polar amino acid transport system permease protein
VPELTFAASQLNNRLLTKPFEIFAILAIVYFIVCWSLSELANQLEQRIARQRLGEDPPEAGPSQPGKARIQGAI